MTMGMFGRRVSWAAIFAGVIAATFVQLLLTALGTGIGANVAGTADNVVKELGVGAGIWLAVSSLIALFIGGWVAGRLSGIPRKTEGVLHGFLTASLGTLFVLYLSTSAIGSVFGGASRLLGNGIQGAGANPNVQQQVSNVIGDLQGQVQNVTPQQAAQTADRAAPGVALAGYGFFLMLLLGCGAAMAGGYASAPKLIRVENNPPRY